MMKKLILGLILLSFFLSTSFVYAGEKEELQLQKALCIEIIKRATYEAELAKREIQEIEKKIQAISQKEKEKVK